MEIIGHSRISLTLGTYSHIVPELSMDEAGRMGTALWGTTANTDDRNDHLKDVEERRNAYL